MKNNTKKEIPLWKKILQWIFTILMVSLLWDFWGGIFDEVSGKVREDENLAFYINEGQYGQCVDYFYILKSLNEENMDDEMYAPYKEFVDFYENYMFYVEYTAYNEAKGTGKYADEADLCVERMKEINEATTFFDNRPHYEYLLESIENN